MSDIVTLQIGNQRIENFISYDIEADLYQAADMFKLELSNPEAPVTAGMQCQLYVNGQLELTGLIDKTARKYDKGGSSLSVEGRDLLSLLVDSHVEDFVTLQNKTVKEIAEFLIYANPKTGRPAIPYISRKNIVGGAFIGKGKGKKKTGDNPFDVFLSTPQKFSQIEPGMSVFEALATYAASRGLMFFALPDGTLVFGRPKITGQPLFNVTTFLSGQGNNVESGEEINDISRRYSKITVVSQVQGLEEHGADPSKVNVKKPVYDPDFPFYKPQVVKLNHDSQTPALYGRMLLEKQKHDGYSLAYTAPLHSQSGHNWAINELCTVNDEVLNINRTLLVFNRRFRKTKQGSWTDIKLGPPGLVVAPN